MTAVWFKNLQYLKFLIRRIVIFFRGHTLTYTGHNGKIHSCGLGGNGQLGTGDYSNRSTPIIVKGRFVPYQNDNFKKPNTPISTSVLWRPAIVKQIYAGGDQSIATVSLQHVRLILSSHCSRDILSCEFGKFYSCLLIGLMIFTCLFAGWKVGGGKTFVFPFYEHPFKCNKP